MLRGARRLALTSGLGLLLGTGTAAAANPSVLLARQLKGSMQASYDRSYKGLKLTTVTCTIAAGEASARCRAHFTIRAQRVVGVFQVAAAIDSETGGVSTRTTSVKCKDSKTGAPVRC